MAVIRSLGPGAFIASAALHAVILVGLDAGIDARKTSHRDPPLTATLTLEVEFVPSANTESVPPPAPEVKNDAATPMAPKVVAVPLSSPPDIEIPPLMEPEAVRGVADPPLASSHHRSEGASEGTVIGVSSDIENPSTAAGVLAIPASPIDSGSIDPEEAARADLPVEPNVSSLAPATAHKLENDFAAPMVAKAVPAPLPSPSATQIPHPVEPGPIRRGADPAVANSSPSAELPAAPDGTSVSAPGHRENPTRVVSLLPADQSPSDPADDVDDANSSPKSSIPAPDARLSLMFEEGNGFTTPVILSGGEPNFDVASSTDVLIHDDVMMIQSHISHAWSKIVARMSPRMRRFALEIELRLRITGGIKRLIIYANDRETSVDPRFPLLARKLIDDLLREQELPLTPGAYAPDAVLIWRFWL